MHKTLQQQAILEQLRTAARVGLAPVEDVVHRVDGGVGGAVGAGLHVERDFPPEYLGAEFEFGVAAQEHGEHIAREFVLGDFAGGETRQCGLAAGLRGSEEARVELLERCARGGDDLGVIPLGVKQRGRLAEALDAVQQGRGFGG